MMQYLYDLFVVLGPVLYVISVLNMITAWRSRDQAIADLKRATADWVDARQCYAKASADFEKTERMIAVHIEDMRHFHGLMSNGQFDEAIDLLRRVGYRVNVVMDHEAPARKH